MCCGRTPRETLDGRDAYLEGEADRRAEGVCQCELRDLHKRSHRRPISSGALTIYPASPLCPPERWKRSVYGIEVDAAQNVQTIDGLAACLLRRRPPGAVVDRLAQSRPRATRASTSRDRAGDPSASHGGRSPGRLEGEAKAPPPAQHPSAVNGPFCTVGGGGTVSGVSY